MAQLFEPRRAYRFHNRTSAMSAAADPTVGQNPSNGAAIHHWLGEVPDGEVTISIADADGNIVRTLSGPSQAGINRVWWNLRGENATPVRFRTP